MSEPDSPSESPPDEELPDYEIEAGRTFSAKVRACLRDWRFWLLMALLAAGCLAVWQGPSLYREAKTRRALGLIAEGETQVAAGDMTSAASLFRRGMLMAPGDPRILARINLQNASFGNAEAVAALRHKMEEKTATPLETLVVAEQAIHGNDVAGTTRALDSLPQSLEPDLDGRRAAVLLRLLLIQGRPAESLKTAQEASDRLPGREGDEVRLLLGELLLRANPPREVEANKLLCELSAKPTREGAGALRLLAQYRTLHPDSAVLSADEITALLKKHAGRSIADDLLLADLALAVRPQDRAAIFSALVDEQKKPESALPDRIAVGRWLVKKQAHAEAARLVTEQDATNNMDALFVRIDALSGQNLWLESRALLEKTQNTGLPDVLRHLFLARIAEELGSSAEAENEWTSVHSGLRLADAPSIRFIARYAEARHQRTEATAAFRLLADRPETKVEGLTGLIRILPSNTSTAESLEIYRQLLEAAPDLADARGGVAYFSLLTDRDLEKSRQIAQDLLRSQPDSPAFQSIAALAELRRHDPAAALKTYGETDWKTAADNWKAVRVAVLLANGRREDAETLQATIRLENLREEERELLGGTR